MRTHILETREKCLELGIDFRTKEFLGEWKGKLYGTVAENVAFGKDFDKGKVVNALKKANIYDFLMQKEGIETIVGEGGIKLSVGQKQRIGIARALYDDPEFLVLDEATSALDTKTESRIMSEIFEVSKNKTLLIIAHRLSTTDRCDAIYALQNGMLKNKDELLAKVS